MSDLFSISGKTILVIGSSRGIGFELASQLFELGANVYGISRTSVRPASFRQVECDITDYNTTQHRINDILAHAHVDALINVAGITRPSIGLGSLQSMNDFVTTLNTNLLSIYHVISIVAPHMIKREKGSIVNITSISSLLGFPNNPGYVSSKGGLSSLTKALSVDYGKHGVRVNNIVPGYFRTDMTASSFADPELHSQRSNRTSLGRWGEVSELLGPAVFLISSASSYVTGADIVVDGGWTSRGL